MPVDFIGMLKYLFMFLCELSKNIGMVLPDILKMIRAWSEYWQNKNQRLKDAMAEEVATKLKAQQNQARKEIANLKAAMYIYDQAEKDTYNQLFLHLNSDKPESALLMLRKEQFPAASAIIFDSDSPNAIKAQLLTDLIFKD